MRVMTIDMNRRSFLRGSLCVAGASVVVAKGIIPNVPRIVGDGIHDDTEGIQAALNGEPFLCDGSVISNATDLWFDSGNFRLTKTLFVKRDWQSIRRMHCFADHDEPILDVTASNVYIGDCYFKTGRETKAADSLRILLSVSSQAQLT